MSDTMFTVSGLWPFPHEMLAHDNAVPASKADADTISHMMTELDDEDPRATERQYIALLLKNEPDRSPDVGAWAAAGWQVQQEYVL
jgi:hypothetical protein